ncbi:PadR family transcriptional regulator [Leptotrichia sp. OH3620_COT-345]|uniref:PadR family transcriptional regulator n=1 Tax=Leptotrichia sp. OH3620_COT-345 TaxID=2491048 RepID=UPI000F64B218|nr:helix-turn-helix transcriptional regulator [Leptotrichia sp. OH3620_COT-345]RRD40874.1 PadR family transcriptional regulator [Leptotrichia sp. OH3620_COT-345]
MKYIVLGILILKKSTVYEIRNIIKENFKSMCSDSMGSIQASLKKLLSEEMIIFKKYTERNINKKVYYITEIGRKEFLEWIKTPLNMGQMKNIELGKLLFMGLVPKEKRLLLIEEIIKNLEKEIFYLKKIMKKQKEFKEREKLTEYFKNNQEYSEKIMEANQSKTIDESISEIYQYEILTLQLGIDTTEFYVNWFKKVKKNIKKGDIKILKI